MGIDVGTTSTQMVVSELVVENRASGFSVPELAITERRILYKSPVHFTPLREGQLVDSAGIREILEGEYRAAGIRRDQVDTGAVIITGETSRKENARRVLDAISDMAGDFVVATAGPDLESVLAAKGAGAVEHSLRTGETVLHMDIGGGTSNLALLRNGVVAETGCLNVGGRLLKFDRAGRISYVSPVLEGLCGLRAGDIATRQQVMEVARLLAQGLEMAAGLRPPGELLDMLWTRELDRPAEALTRERVTLSFSGGVADCIERDHPWLEFGDMGPELGRAIRESRLCQGKYILGRETIRATVIGAGCHSAQLSGSTVFCQSVALPLKNLPVIHIPEAAGPEEIRRALGSGEGMAVLAMAGPREVCYADVETLAQRLAAAGTEPMMICLEQDMAKALGQALAVRLGEKARILCIDRVRLPEGSFLDVGAPIGPALPVVVKTLVLGS